VKPVTSIAADFDRIADAIAADARPDRLSRAERFLLSQVPADAKTALDVGCGDGAISRTLAARGIATVGIDVSPRMIAVARARSRDLSLLEYRIGDVTTDQPPERFDLVVSVAMAHHVPLERVVNYMRSAVAPGGVLIIQDVTSRSGLRHLPVNALAWLARRLKIVPPSRNGAEIEVLYETHGAGEEYLGQSKVSEAYRELLPGARVHHHLEWRYTVVWRSDVRGP
jgi:2-polyprenyl-3-methyl-5-hydroxy-6-metoxy-1,4-benzoquinol methylase